MSGNYAWLNLVTMVIAVAAVPDAFFRRAAWRGRAGGRSRRPPVWFMVAVGARLTVLVVVLSYWPVRNLIGRPAAHELRLQPVSTWSNTYGAFGSVTRERYEVVIEGRPTTELTADTDVAGVRVQGQAGRPAPPAAAGRAVPPAARLADVVRRAVAAATPRTGSRRCCGGSWRGRPGPGGCSGAIRSRTRRRSGCGPATIRYRFTTRAERRASGAWWVRQLAGDYLRPMSLTRGRRGA